MLPYATWLVWIFPIVASLFVPLIGRLGGKATGWFCVIMGVITTIIAFSIIPDIWVNPGAVVDSTIPWIPVLGINAGIFIDPLSILFVNLISFFGLVILIYSIGYMGEEDGLPRYYFFVLFFIGAMNGLVLADNFLQMFVFWEIVGMCSYALVSFYYKRSESVQAGIKVFLMTRIGDVLLLLAIAILYFNLGSFSFSYLISHIGSIPLPNLTLIAFLMLGGVIAKSAQMPLHTWLYSAMEAPTSVSALLHGATMVKAGVYLVARLIIMLGPIALLIPNWLSFISWLGALSALIGAILAVQTPDIKGVPAYSTISQIGFMLAALGTFASSGSLGWFAGLFHLLSHAFFQGLGFLAIGGIVHSLGTRDMRKMGGLRKEMPITFGLCIIVMFARTGVPPFASFFSKGLIMSSLFSTNDVALVITVYAAMAITFAYTLRFIILTFFRKKSDYLQKVHLHEPPKIMLFAAGILAALCCAWGFLGNQIASFMGVPLEISAAEIFSPPTLIFLLVLCIGGIPVYFYYYKDWNFIEKFRTGVIKRLDPLFNHGLFFDDVYEKGIAGGITTIAQGLNKYAEKSVFSRFPQLVASGVVRLAQITHKYLDIVADKMLVAVGKKISSSASRIKKTRIGSLQHYIAAAAMGFFIIFVVIFFITS